MDVWEENTWEFNIIFKGKAPVSVAPFSTVGGRKGRVWSRAEENAGHDLPCRRPKKDPVLG